MAPNEVTIWNIERSAFNIVNELEQLNRLLERIATALEQRQQLELMTRGK